MNIGVLLELGRVLGKDKARKSKHVTACVPHGRYERNLTWISTIKDYLEVNGMLSFFLNAYENKPPFIHKKDIPKPFQINFIKMLLKP